MHTELLILQMASSDFYGESGPEPNLQSGSGIVLGVIGNPYPENFSPPNQLFTEISPKMVILFKNF